MCENAMTHTSRTAGKCPAETPIGVGAHFIVLLYVTLTSLKPTNILRIHYLSIVNMAIMLQTTPMPVRSTNIAQRRETLSPSDIDTCGK